MLVPSFCCTTGSFLHSPGRGAAKKIADHMCLLGGIYCVDIIAAVALGIIGLATLMVHAPHALTTLPLFVKVTLMISGVLLFALDTIYLCYRIRQGQLEIRMQTMRLKREIAKNHDTTEMCIREEISKTQEAIRLLEEDKGKGEADLSQMKASIETIQNSLLKMVQTDPNWVLLAENLSKIKFLQQEIEKNLESIEEQLIFYKKKLEDYELANHEMRV